MCRPKKVPLTVAVFASAAIIGHIMPFGIAPNGFLACSRTRQAAAASGCVPPGGSQRSVQCLGAPAWSSTVMVSDTLAACEPRGAADRGDDEVAGASPADPAGTAPARQAHSG